MRSIQNLLGPDFTTNTQTILGFKGTRFVREMLGRSARHRIQVQRRREAAGCGVDEWVICPDTLISDGILYSLGVGNIIAFDLEIIEKKMLKFLLKLMELELIIFFYSYI